VAKGAEWAETRRELDGGGHKLIVKVKCKVSGPHLRCSPDFSVHSSMCHGKAESTMIRVLKM